MTTTLNEAAPVVFLDIDGVLVSRKDRLAHRSHSWLDEAKVARLSKAVLACGAKIVVSSTWRRDANCRTILITNGLSAPFHADWRTAPSIHPRDMADPHQPRASEIADWLKRNGLSKSVSRQMHASYAIIDDNFELFPDQMENLISVDPNAGLTDGHCEQIISHLTGHSFHAPLLRRYS